jgi:hypothetical protein
MDSTEGEHLKAGHPPALKVTSTSIRSYYVNVPRPIKYSSVVQEKKQHSRPDFGKTNDFRIQRPNRFWIPTLPIRLGNRLATVADPDMADP